MPRITLPKLLAVGRSFCSLVSSFLSHCGKPPSTTSWRSWNPPRNLIAGRKAYLSCIRAGGGGTIVFLVGDSTFGAGLGEGIDFGNVGIGCASCKRLALSKGLKVLSGSVSKGRKSKASRAVGSQSMQAADCLWAGCRSWPSSPALLIVTNSTNPSAATTLVANEYLLATSRVSVICFSKLITC